MTYDQVYDRIAQRMEEMLLAAVGEERRDEAIELAAEIAETFAAPVKELIANEPPRGIDANEIDHQLFNVTNRAVMAGSHLNEILRGLAFHTAFWWSTICPSCRKEAASDLERSIPDLLAMADECPTEDAKEDCGKHRSVH
jgi:hypothetical protein